MNRIPRREYSCSKCYQSFLTKASLNVHLRSHFEHKCSNCLELFPSYPLLIKHQEEEHGAGNFRCDLCNKYFFSPSHLHFHMVGVHKKRTVKCLFCKERLLSYESLGQHLREEHGQFDVSCHSPVSTPGLTPTISPFQASTGSKPKSDDTTIFGTPPSLTTTDIFVKDDVAKKEEEKNEVLEYYPENLFGTIQPYGQPPMSSSIIGFSSPQNVLAAYQQQSANMPSISYSHPFPAEQPGAPLTGANRAHPLMGPNRTFGPFPGRKDRYISTSRSGRRRGRGGRGRGGRGSQQRFDRGRMRPSSRGGRKRRRMEGSGDGTQINSHQPPHKQPPLAIIDLDMDDVAPSLSSNDDDNDGNDDEAGSGIEYLETVNLVEERARKALLLDVTAGGSPRVAGQKAPPGTTSRTPSTPTTEATAATVARRRSRSSQPNKDTDYWNLCNSDASNLIKGVVVELIERVSIRLAMDDAGDDPIPVDPVATTPSRPSVSGTTASSKLGRSGRPNLSVTLRDDRRDVSFVEVEVCPADKPEEEEDDDIDILPEPGPSTKCLPHGGTCFPAQLPSPKGHKFPGGRHRNLLYSHDHVCSGLCSVCFGKLSTLVASLEDKVRKLEERIDGRDVRGVEDDSEVDGGNLDMEEDRDLEIID